MKKLVLLVGGSPHILRLQFGSPDGQLCEMVIDRRLSKNLSVGRTFASLQGPRRLNDHEFKTLKSRVTSMSDLCVAAIGF